MNRSSDTRFAHLLEPIRDLARNWNIDIANELEEYLEELEQITVSFDGGHTSVDFAEAALLIQGSACVYSKKVEYLYSLLFQTLNALIQKKQKEASINSTSGKDVDAMFEREAEFLPLDDLVQEGANIDMKECLQTYEYTKNRRRTLVARTPMSLLSMTHGGGDGDKSASRFAVNKCVVHESGALLLEDRSYHKMTPDGTITPAHVLPFGSPATLNLDRNRDRFQNVKNTRDIGDDDDIDGGSGGGGGGGENIPRVLDYGNDDNDVDIDFGGDGPEYDYDGVQPQHNDPFSDDDNGDELPNDDPWEEMDPHETAPDDLVRAVKVGRSYRVPSATLLAKFSEPLLSIMPVDIHSSGGNYTTINKTTLRKVYYPEFATMYARHREELRKLRVKQRQQTANNKNHEPLEEYADGPDYDFYDGNDGIDNDFGPNDDHHHPEEIGGGGGGDAENLWEQLGDDNDDHVGDHGYLKLNQAHGGQNDEVDSLSTFEDMCRRHLAQFMETAEAYALETQLSKRVNAWETKLTPLLEEEEKRVAFDIHEYGDEILRRVQMHASEEDVHHGTAVVSFNDVAKDQPRFEVCRLFLASLQLANNGNVDIVSTRAHDVDDDDVNSVSMGLHLLSLDVNHDMTVAQSPPLSAQTPPQLPQDDTLEDITNIQEHSHILPKAKKKKRVNPRTSTKRKKPMNDDEDKDVENNSVANTATTPRRSTRRRRLRKIGA